MEVFVYMRNKLKHELESVSLVLEMQELLSHTVVASEEDLESTHNYEFNYAWYEINPEDL